MSIFTRANKSFLFIILLLLIIGADGLRWEMGVDWLSYKKMFETNLMPGIEFGFRYYVLLLSSLTDNYSVFIFITSVIIYLGNLGVLYYSTRSLLAVSFVLSILPWYAGSMRQFLAASFFALALHFLLKKEKLKFLAWTFLASSFHITAFLLIGILFLYGLHPVYILIILLLSFPLTITLFGYLGALGSLLEIVFASEKDFARRLVVTGDVNPLLGALRKVYSFSLPCVLLISNKRLWSDKKVIFLGSVSLFTFLIYLIGVNYMQILAGRMDYYFSVLIFSFFIGFIDGQLKSSFNKLLLLVFVISLSAVSISRLTEFPLFYPYSSVFYNIDLDRELY
ncbi:EpsG family protein [Gammaproteobacteria bacterium]|nr:EpsG family protein [Gammaproteobacteria bacterium]